MFNLHPGLVVASLDKTICDDYLCLVASSKQQIYMGRSQNVNWKVWNTVNSNAGEDLSKIKAPPSLPREWRINKDQSIFCQAGPPQRIDCLAPMENYHKNAFPVRESNQEPETI